MVPNIVGAIELASQLKNSASIAQNAQAMIKSADKVDWLGAVQNRSLIDVAAPARVEPIVMIDADCQNLESLGDLMQCLHSMFSGYYLQALNMVNHVGNVSVGAQLARFNPNAGASLGFEELRQDARRAVSMEEFKFKLPTMAQLQASKPNIAMESAGDASSQALNTIRDASNLSVGKMVMVQLGSGAETVTVPVAIRLMSHLIPSRVMVELFSNTNAFDHDLGERYHSWKAGRLAFVKDLILCNDLIAKRVRSSIQDKSGVLNMVRSREQGNMAVAAINGKASVANATNLAVLSTDTLDMVEQAQAGSFDNAKVRRAVFESSNLMIIAVVDKQWEQVEFFFRNMDASTKLSLKDLKSVSKDGGGSITEVLKAFMAGSAVRL